MIDPKLLKEKLNDIRENIKNRGVKVDLDLINKLAEEKAKLQKALEDLRAQKNENATKLKDKLDAVAKEATINAGKIIKEKLAQMETDFEKLQDQFQDEFSKLPNFIHPQAPRSLKEEEAVELEIVGTIPKFDFTPKNHDELGVALDIVDFEKGASVSGNKFYFLKNEGVFLELGLVRYAMDIITKHGYTPFITPDLAKVEILEGIGFNPRGDEDNIYVVNNKSSDNKDDKNDLCLIGTAEITLGGYHRDSTISQADLPIRMGGVSHCFRKEAGAAGKFSKGLYRVHQFTKVEMFAICLPKDSDKIHDEILQIEKEIFTGLGIPFRVIDTPSGDLGAPAYRKFDLEAYMPSRGEALWGEVTSTSNCTDYQARRLKIRYKDGDDKGFAHTLNGTAIAISRAIIAIIENFQTADGEVIIPKNLVPYVGFEKISKKNKK